jgi:hypothetical protein
MPRRARATRGHSVPWQNITRPEAALAARAGPRGAKEAESESQLAKKLLYNGPGRGFEAASSWFYLKAACHPQWQWHHDPRRARARRANALQGRWSPVGVHATDVP